MGSLTSLHNLAMLRDTAIAIKLACDKTSVIQSRTKESDPSGKSNLHKELMAKVSELSKQAQDVLKQGKNLVTKLNKDLGNKKAFHDALRDWMKEELANDQGISQGFSSSLMNLIASWQKTIGGWAGVKWEC